jgi:hypothetical protein
MPRLRLRHLFFVTFENASRLLVDAVCLCGLILANCMATLSWFEITVRHIAVGEPLGEGHPRQVVFIGDLALFIPNGCAGNRCHCSIK